MDFLLRIGSYMLLMGAMGYIMNKAGIKGGGCCGAGYTPERQDNQSQGHTGQTDIGINDKNQIEMVVDPVCGMYINPETAIKQNLNGRSYYFCSETCRRSVSVKPAGTFTTK